MQHASDHDQMIDCLARVTDQGCPDLLQLTVLFLRHSLYSVPQHNNTGAVRNYFDGFMDKQECESGVLSKVSTWCAERLLGVFSLTQNVCGTSNIEFRDSKWLVRLGKL